MREGKSDIPTCEWYHRRETWYHHMYVISDLPSKISHSTLISDLMIQGLNPCIKRKSHRKLVWFFLNHWYQRVGRCDFMNQPSFHSFHSFHLGWFMKSHLPTCWYQWFRKNHTRVSVWFPIIKICSRGIKYKCCQLGQHKNSITQSKVGPQSCGVISKWQIKHFSKPWNQRLAKVETN